ncbi:trihelix transcription factor GT-2-like protein [Corchorus olitorius]|uniref:Trihelix transcription factor GT-2-like protein n=1 Tax=Corchorus olitorius TaxID=93759 RepID=A0A1R3HD69_9ROSI|nr:trihelix transcription factor GT-2-like protein [Corchorus olitorius]
MADLRQLMNGRGAPTHFQAIPQAAAADLFSTGRNLPPPQPHHHFDMMQMVAGRPVGHDPHQLMTRGLLHNDFPSDSTANTTTLTAAVAVTSASTPSASCGFDGEAAAFGGDGGTGRWPRQETLTLLEIRSRLDSKFKEANQKGPLWDEVSREKFENLYKYYKKTKEGKAGRQDGKHYRFFRQLEALYGETSNSVSGPETQLVGNSFRFHGNTPNSINTQANQDVYHSSQKLCDSLSLSNSSDFETSSSDDNDLTTEAPMNHHPNDSSHKRKKKRGWKVKIKEFIDSQMRKLMERQEAWLEKLTRTLEQKEQERVLREEEWRKEEAARIDREHRFWAKERAWIEARDSALMDALQNLTGKQLKGSGQTQSQSPTHELMATEILQNNSDQNQNDQNGSHETINKDHGWQESEISRLIQLRSSMESRFHQGGCSGSEEIILWEEIAAKMACLGFERNGLMCKEKWDSISSYLMKTKKRKESSNSRSGCSSFYHNNNEQSSLFNTQGRTYCEITEQGLQPNDGSSPSNSHVGGNAVNVNDSCFRFLMADGEHNLWENYGLKLSNGDQNQ